MVGRLGVVLMAVLAPVAAYAQGVTITGKVISEQGQVLYGANVYITELNISRATNEEGVYTIVLPAERVRGQVTILRVRAIGHTPQNKQITLTAGATLTENFTLKLDVNKLSEVVVTGVTGATEKKNLAFDIVRVDASDLPVPSTNALTQLQGKVPGAAIVTPSGRPGQAPAIVLRGPKSIDASNRSQGPLIIIDGIILNGDTPDLNPMDIESVEVVKGAAAASLYGSRAGAGVIQITTKSGKNAAQGSRINVRGEYGFSDVATEYPFATRTMLMMDPTMTRFCIKVANQPACSRTVDFEQEAMRINDNAGTFALTPYNFERDWGIATSAPKPELKGEFQINRWPKMYNPIATTVTSGQFNNGNIDLSGRFGNTGFFASASNLYQEGAIRYLEGFKRSSERLNVDQQIGDDWTAQMQTFYSRATNYPSGQFFTLTRQVVGADLLRRDSRGQLFVRSNPLNQGSQNGNPLYLQDCCYDKTDDDRFLGSFSTRYSPLNWLDFDANASMDRRRDNQTQLQDRGFRTTTGPATASDGNVSASSSADASYNVSLNATARKSFGSEINTRWNARYLYEQQDGSAVSASGNTLAVQGLLDVDNASTSLNPGSSESSVRAMGGVVGGYADYKGRYIVDGIIRRDGSSLFGSEQRWHNYYRGSFAYRLSDEKWWFAKEKINDLKLRASMGSAGGRPSFAAQYETFNIGTGGVVTADTKGNKNLKPETTTETELGFDAEILGKYGLSVTYARDITRDQILQVPPSVSSGFATRWENAGTLDGKTWEVSLNIPFITNHTVTWSGRASFDQNRTYITALNVPPGFQSIGNGPTLQLRYAVGERYGTVYGKQFVNSCSQLDPQFRAQCGPGKDFQKNDEGYIVWVGAGNSYKEGVTKNLWQATLRGCMKNGAAVNVTGGSVDCVKQGGTVTAPWGMSEVHWGMIIKMLDSTAAPVDVPLGNTTPDYRLSFSQNIAWKRLSAYALVDGSVGSVIMNEDLHWSLGDFMVREEDQDGKTVETAKPIGYYWRAGAPAAGVGGFYDVLGGNNHTVESGTYTKLREVSLSYAIGRIRGVGDWTISLIGRNLLTLTDYKGWDPEVGFAGGRSNSAAIGAVQSRQYPQTRTFTVTVGSRF